MRGIRTALAIAALVGGAAGAPFLATTDAEARPSGASFTRAADNTRAVHARRGPFYGLRVNSMDVNSAVKVVSCYGYRCPGDSSGTFETYQLVRSHQVDRDITLQDCDEVLSVLDGDDVRFRADAKTTRWIRDVGPNGVTPVGGWIGRMVISVIVSPSPQVAARAPLLDFALIGTQGLRPRRGDADDPADEDEADRCSAPYHDEGYYQGRADRRGVRLLRRLYHGDARRLAHLSTLYRSLIVGTFEGRMGLDVDRDDPYDFCQLRKTAWWFDGVMGHRCRQQRPADERPTPDPLPEDEPLFEDAR